MSPWRASAGSRRRFLAALAAFSFFACGAAAPDVYVFDGRSMGTTWSVKLVGRNLPAEEIESLRGRLSEAIEDVNRRMSTYREDSELSRLNQAPTGEPVALSPQTMAVFTEARRIGELTGGALDVTVGPLVNAWGFGPGERAAVDDSRIQEMLKAVGWDRIAIGADSVKKLVDGVYCDLSSVAKGYAVDRVAEALSELGHADYMVEIGGEVRAHGLNGEGRPWRIAIEEPVEGERSIQRVIPLADAAMATSGDYRNFWVEDGLRYSHTIDPRTGRPVRHRLASVTVIEPTCMRADGLATALMALGEEEGFRKAQDLEVAALFQIRGPDGGFGFRSTPAFAKLVAD